MYYMWCLEIVAIFYAKSKSELNGFGRKMLMIGLIQIYREISPLEQKDNSIFWQVKYLTSG